jgi:hypothetical protein
VERADFNLDVCTGEAYQKFEPLRWHEVAEFFMDLADDAFVRDSVGRPRVEPASVDRGFCVR